MKTRLTQTGLQMRLAARGLPVHRETGFFGSSEGRKVLLYGAALAAVMFAISWGQISRERRALDADGRVTPAEVVATDPPRAFVPADVKHRLLAVEDGSEMCSVPALRAVLGHLRALHTPSAAAGASTAALTLPNADAVVDLRIQEALADPAAFRGGWVKTDGVVTTLWTEGLNDPDSADGMLPIYRGILVENPKSTGVAFITATKPPDFTIVRDSVALRGVFLQNLRFRTKDENIPVRDVPLLVVDEFIVTSRAQGQTAGATYLPIAVVTGAVVIILVVLMLLRRNSRLAPLRQRRNAKP